jgi:hypothetical protein
VRWNMEEVVERYPAQTGVLERQQGDYQPMRMRRRMAITALGYSPRSQTFFAVEAETNNVLASVHDGS